MWIFQSDTFQSIVADPQQPDMLKVRARFAGDIERLFPGVEVIEGAGTDYPYRTWVGRDRVASTLAEAARNIGATNSKASVREGWWHDAYVEVWEKMLQTQRELDRA